MNIPLNIDWQQILLHLFNFIILFAILYFLLYKPVKEFMDKRIAYYKQLDDEAKLNLENSEQIKQDYMAKLANSDKEISAQKEAAGKETEAANAERIKQAKAEAERIVADARQTSEKERARMLQQAQKEITDMVVTATEKIVAKADTAESYEQFLHAVERGAENE